MPGAGTAEPHVDAFMGQHTNALDCAAHNDAPCSAAAPTGQTGMVDRSDRSRRGSPTRIQRTPAREGPRRGRRTLGCPRLGRPARAFSNAIEMKEEHHVEVRKAMVKIKGKVNCVNRLGLPSIGRGPSYIEGGEVCTR